MRPSRVWAVARSDWAIELKGRQGLVLPGVLVALLLPAAWVPSPLDRARENVADVTSFAARGDVPPEVRALPGYREHSANRLTFRRESPLPGSQPGEDLLWVEGPFVPAEVRQVLDEGHPAVRVEVVPRGFRFPKRTMLFAMVSASTLTGAVASSIGGERSRRTLVVLLSAAVSRAEVVAGKAFAWASWGVGSAVLAATAAWLWGRAELGWWVFPMVAVPVATVSLGLWLVRSAADVVAGTATSLRALPAVLSITAVIAFLLGEWNPLLGAVVPLGGALIAAGDTWEGVAAPAVAVLSTSAFAVAALLGTVRDLEEHPEREPPEAVLAIAGFGALIGVVCWWLPVLAPLLWAPAGNPGMLEGLPVQSGIVAGSVCLLATSVVRAARGGARRERSAPDLAPAWGWAAAVAVGLALPFLPSMRLAPFDAAPLLAERMAAAASPVLPLALLAIAADELMFRGWLQRGAGAVLATLVWVVVKTPLDPVQGLLGGALLAGVVYLARTPLAAVLARLLALAVTSLS